MNKIRQIKIIFTLQFYSLEKLAKIILTGLFFLGVNLSFSQVSYQVKGMILQDDTTTGAPFAYVINTTTHSGVISDISGKFVIAATDKDSLMVKMLGYKPLVIHVKQLKNENDSVKVFKKFYLVPTIYQLGTVYVNTFKLKPNEREYMKRIINVPRVEGINVAESPLTALWQNFSKKGREMQKLRQIFEEVLRKEEVEKKLNTDILRKLLEDDSITLEKFRIACPEITDDFILYTQGYDLYSTITASWKSWKKKNKMK